MGILDWNLVHMSRGFSTTVKPKATYILWSNCSHFEFVSHVEYDNKILKKCFLLKKNSTTQYTCRTRVCLDPSSLHCALSLISGAVYCNRSCLFVCLFAGLFNLICYLDNSKLRAYRSSPNWVCRWNQLEMVETRPNL